ncbi:MAG TPA: type II secretion system F family protein [Candidatus Dormibacteraeota bacterium]
MQRYNYRALTSDGDTVRGLMEALRPADVHDALTARSLRVVTVKRRRTRLTLSELFPGSFKVSTQHIALFCRELATFVRVGVPVTPAIATIAEQSSNPRLRAACATMAADLERGAALSEAVAAHPAVFPVLMVDMIRAAEVSGSLDKVLKQVAQHIEREANARRKVRAAMAYPFVVVVMAFFISIGLVTFVLPQFRTLFESFHADLPKPVALMLGTSDFLRAHAIPLLIGLLALMLLGGRFARSASGRLTMDRLVLRLPLFGKMYEAAIVERFCRTLSDMLVAGVPITQTFPVVIESTNNRVYKRALRTVAAQMAVGEGFSRPMRRTGLFPPVVTQMIKVGEETGTLDENLNEAAELYSEELDMRIKRMTAIIEPALILAVAAIVGFLAISMIEAIYSLAGTIK